MAATSSLPSAEPCDLPVFCRFGAGQAMIERRPMIDGRSRLSRAAASAANSDSTSFASSTVWVCQPYASYRASTSSENATAVSPSIEMWLSS